MGIALVIVGGVTLITIVGMAFDFLTKRRKRTDDETTQTVAQMEKRIANLEQAVKEKDDRMAALEGELSFLRRLIEKQ